MDKVNWLSIISIMASIATVVAMYMDAPMHAVAFAVLAVAYAVLATLR